MSEFAGKRVAGYRFLTTGAVFKKAASVQIASRPAQIFIERRGDGKYAVKREGADRASAITDTQKEAIQRAKEIAPGTRPDVERVRDTKAGGRDKWRSA
jgi:uncharacterized protein YdaT